MSFKLGDTLICINNNGAARQLTIGREYKVVRAYPDNDNFPIEFRVISDLGDDVGYSCDRFKLKEEKEDMSNTFNLEDLKTGMKLTMSEPWHSNCPEYIVLLNTDYGDVLVNTEANSWNSLSDIKMYGNILKVEVPDCPFNLKGATPKWKTIWERQVKSEQDIEKENLQKVIDKLQQDLQNAQQQLDNLGGK